MASPLRNDRRRNRVERNAAALPGVGGPGKTQKRIAPMKTTLALAVVAVALMACGPAVHAKGCIKGAIVGGVAGHYAGHHGVLGAAAGCVVGRHEANKHARQKAQQNTGQAPSK